MVLNYICNTLACVHVRVYMRILIYTNLYAYAKLHTSTLHTIGSMRESEAAEEGDDKDDDEDELPPSKRQKQVQPKHEPKQTQKQAKKELHQDIIEDKDVYDVDEDDDE